MEIKRFTKIATLGLVLFLSARAQALSYTADTFSFPDARGGSTYAYGINDNGIVAGSYSILGSTEGYGFIYNAGAFTQISAPGASGAHGGTFVTDINNNGSVTGHYYSPAQEKEIGFIYNGNSYTSIDASPLNSNRTTNTTPTDINDSELVTGSLTDYATGTQFGFRYDNGVLSTVIPMTAEALFATLTGMNNADQLVGAMIDEGGTFHGYIADGSSISIFDTPNATNTFFDGISNNHQVLGHYSDATGTHYFVFTNGTYQTIELPQLSASSIVLYDINNSGQIVGSAYGGIAGAYGFVLTPVPAPATMGLFASSLLGLAGFQRRSKVRHQL
ncbi:MAG: hypothetical protein QM709_13540 [Spongiibacteraceae bacterium]